MIETKSIKEQSLIEELRTRALIRRSIPRVPAPGTDRIADLCDRAAARIERLEQNILILGGSLD